MSRDVALAAVRVRIPLRRPFRSATGTWLDREAWLLRITDADGRAGVGEASLAPEANAADRALLAERVRGLIEDRAPLWGDLAAADPGALPTDAAGLALRHAVRTALLDLHGTGIGASTGRARRVKVNATIGDEGTVATLVAVRAGLAAGFTTFKLKGGSEPSTNALLRRLAAVREAVGPGVALRLDVNGAWTRDVARERLAALAPIHLEYVEQPIAVGTPADLAALRTTSPVPIAADESVASLSDARALLVAGAVDVLVVKPSRVGGPDVALAIAAEAAAHGAGVTISTLLDTGVGIAVAVLVAARLPEGIGRAHGLATGSLLEATLLVVGPGPVLGAMSVPRGRGLGITVDPGAVARYAVEHLGAW